MGFMGVSSAATAGGAGAAGGGTLLAAAPLISAFSGAISAGGNASAQRSVLQYQQGVAQGNALLAEQRATDALTQGAQAVGDLQQRVGQVKGAQRASFAANGVDLKVGSPVQIAASTDWARDVDIATIRNNAARSAWGYRVQGANAGAQAGAYGAAAGAVSPIASSASSLLGSASGVASKWYDIYKNGGFGSTGPTNLTDNAESGSSLYSSSGLFGN